MPWLTLDEKPVGERDVLKVLTEAYIESVSDVLASLLVEHWRSQHPAQPMGHIPPGDLTVPACPSVTTDDRWRGAPRASRSLCPFTIR